MTEPIHLENQPWSGHTLHKLLRRPEYEFVKKCRDIMEQLTGEKFTVESPPWLLFAGMQLQMDGYCEKLKQGLDFTPCNLYNLPEGQDHMHGTPDYQQMLQYIAEARIVYCGLAGVALIPIPCIMSDEQLVDYLDTKLHELTKFRVWVGSPRCKCHTAQ